MINKYIVKSKIQLYFAWLKIYWSFFIRFQWNDIFKMTKNFSKDGYRPVFVLLVATKKQIDEIDKYDKRYMNRFMRKYKKLFKKDLVILSNIIADN